MNSGFSRGALAIVLLLLGFIALQPYVERAFFSASTPRSIQPRGDYSELERTTIQLFETISPSVVQVAARPAALGQVEDQGGGGAGSSGTGFVWDGAGHIVTNDHVLQGATTVAIRFSTGEVAEARVVGVAPNYDLAIIRASGVRRLPPVIPVGASADLKVGQAAFAIGNPFGLDQSLTSGIISALKRRLPTAGGREITDVIQTDAAINPGNSGGPLLDSAGRLIGVTTAIISPSGSSAGIGFAVPVDVVNRVVPQLIRDGRVPTPGIGIVAASESAGTRMGVEGLIIVRTAPGSPAERAGLRGVDLSSGTLGDVITEAEGKRVRRLSDLTDEIERVGVGRSLKLTVSRNGQTRTVELPIVDIGAS